MDAARALLSQESTQLAAFQEADINRASAAGYAAAWRRHKHQIVLSPPDTRGLHRVALASSLPLKPVTLPLRANADRVAAGLVAWPVPGGSVSVLVISFYGFQGDPERTSLVFASLMEEVALYGGLFVVLGDFNMTQAEGSVAALLASRAISAADDVSGTQHPCTNPTNTRRIDFALTHSSLLAQHVHTFRSPALSDHGIVRVDFPTVCFPPSWTRPAFEEAPPPAEAPAGALTRDAGPDIAACLEAGSLDEAWTRLSDWAEDYLGIRDPTCRRSAPWLPERRPTPLGHPGPMCHEPTALITLRRLARRLCQLVQQPWDTQLAQSISRSLRRARMLVPDLPHLDLACPADARDAVDSLVQAQAQQHRQHCIQRWKTKTAVSPECALAWVKHRADQELRLSQAAPLQEVADLQVHPADRVQVQGEAWTRKWQSPATMPDVTKFAQILQGLPRHPTTQVDLEPRPDELRKATSKMRAKAPGPDGWTGNLLLRLPDSWWAALSALWATVLRRGQVPGLWQRSLIVLLDKGHQATRPIALLSFAWRAGARVIAQRLRDWIGQWCDHRACGSAPGRSPVDVHRRIFCAWKSGTHSFIQQDLSAFFDSLSVPIVRAALEHLGAPPALVRLIHGFYGRQLRLFAIDGFTSPRWHRAHHGMLQGCPLSPILSLCVGFLWSQHVAAQGVEAGIFVDDRVLWLTDRSPAAPAMARAALQRSDLFDKAAGLTCNRKKCHLVTSQDHCPWRDEASTRGYEIGSEMQFLGIELCLASGQAVPLKLNLRKLQARLRHASNPAFAMGVRQRVVKSLIFPALFWAAGVALPSPTVLTAIRNDVSAAFSVSLTHEAPRVLVGQVLGWSLDVQWVADWSALSALGRALTQRPAWHEHLSLAELAFLSTSSLPGVHETLCRLGWRLVFPARALERRDDAGRTRVYYFGEDSPVILRHWLTEAHKAQAIATCGRVRRKLHRPDPSLPVGLDLPGPPRKFRFAFQGHKKVYDAAKTLAERRAALATGGTGWYHQAKQPQRRTAVCFCSKLWPSRAHLMWTCPEFADARGGLPAPTNRAEERLLGQAIPEFPPAPALGVQKARPALAQLLRRAADEAQHDLLFATDGSSEKGVGSWAVVCCSPADGAAGADSAEDQTPFRMELKAILELLETLATSPCPPRRATILVDCEAALKAIEQPANSGHCLLATRAQQAGFQARRRGVDWRFVWVPSHGKRPSWTPPSPLQASVCRQLNQKADECANAHRRLRLLGAERDSWYDTVARATQIEAEMVRLSAKTSDLLEVHLCTDSGRAVLLDDDV